MGLKSKHRRLYKQIPTFKCPPGCNRCCGPVPITDFEAALLGIPGAKATPTKLDGHLCMFSSKNGCRAYHIRPFMCRLFGSVSDPLLVCPYGFAPKNPLSEEDGKRLTEEYKKLY